MADLGHEVGLNLLGQKMWEDSGVVVDSEWIAILAISRQSLGLFSTHIQAVQLWQL